VDNTLIENDSAKAYVINAKTGEQTNVLNEGDKIVRASSIKSFKTIKQGEEGEQGKVECEKWKMKEFYKANVSEIQLLSKDLSQGEKAFLFSIAPYVSFDDNSLQIGHGKKAVDIGTEDLVEITGMSRSAVYDTINTLAAKDVIYRGKNSRNKQYYVNPWLYCKGNRINKVLKNMFKNYKVRSKSNISWNDLLE